MSILLTQDASLREALAAATRPLRGMWICSGSALVAEICAGSGLDLLLIDVEHAPNDLLSVLHQLHAIAAYAPVPVVRLPVGDPVLIKQYLDVGARTVVVPMVESADEAAQLVAATRYPPSGTRGVGSALARASRWNRIDGYLATATESVSLVLQIESGVGVEHAQQIAAVPGVDAIFLGPADLAASLGHLGQQAHPEVVEAVCSSIAAVHSAGKPVGVNAFDPTLARRYLDAGADFVIVGADVTLLAAGSDRLALALEESP